MTDSSSSFFFQIPNHVAIKIALELKKLLVDNSLLDVSQSDLEANLFKLMEKRGYGEDYINRYKMMTRFHHQRVPLVVLVCGTACTGKSTIATQLAGRLNLPNVLQVYFPFLLHLSCFMFQYCYSFYLTNAFPDCNI
jgi:2-phosphoglycerate kinase